MRVAVEVDCQSVGVDAEMGIERINGLSQYFSYLFLGEVYCSECVGSAIGGIKFMQREGFECKHDDLVDEGVDEAHEGLLLVVDGEVVEGEFEEVFEAFFVDEN